MRQSLMLRNPKTIILKYQKLSTMTLPKSIKEHQENLAKRVYTAVEAVDSYLARIKNTDKNYNSFITVTDEYAYQKAKAVDEIIKNNPNAFFESPLLGVVFSIKDLYLTKNIRTTASSKVLEN